MPCKNAPEFLASHGKLVIQPVKAWEWDAGDDDFGKRFSLPIPPFATATVELQLNQLSLVITERDNTVVDADTTVVFDALIQFEEGFITMDGLTHPITDTGIQFVLNEFNLRIESQAY